MIIESIAVSRDRVGSFFLDNRIEETMANATESTKTTPRKIWNLDIGDKVRNEELDGRKFIVVPMTMILEGVHTGSQGPVYYSVDELAKTPKMWNMKPVLIEHPFRGDTATDLEVYKKQAVGMIMNTYFDTEEGKLKAEAWIDKDLAQSKYPQLLEHIEYRLPMEVSTGLFSELILEPGVWKGEEYKGRIVNIRADHLAILPHKQGACSLADGAGLLINQSFDEPDSKGGKEQLFVFTTVINGEYPPGTPMVEGVEVDEPKAPQKPRLKNTYSDVAPMVKPIEGSHPYEVDTPEFRMVIIPKTRPEVVSKSEIPSMPIANYSEPDEEDLPIPEKPEEAIQDNAKILTPEERKAEAVEDAKTGKKDHYMELKNRLAAALIRRHIKSTKNVKKKRQTSVKNEQSGELPSFALDKGAFTWDVPQKDIHFRAQKMLYDNMINKPRFTKFNTDFDDLETIKNQLSSILLFFFPVSNVNKIRGLMDFAKTLPQEQSPFKPADIALVDHTLAQLNQVRADRDSLTDAARDFRAAVKSRASNDKFYNMPVSFLTGKMSSAFSPVTVTKGSIKDTIEAVDQKLNISKSDTPAVTKAKKALGHAAIVLGKYAEKGLKSDVHIKLLIGDSRDNMMRDILSTVYSNLSSIFTGKPIKDTERDKNSVYKRWSNDPQNPESSYSEHYDRCRKLLQEVLNPKNRKVRGGGSESTGGKDGKDGKDDKNKRNPFSALKQELGYIVGLKPIPGTPPGFPRGLLGQLRLSNPTQITKATLSRITPYVKEIVDMLLIRLQYDDALAKARAAYDTALASIDTMNLPEDVKEEFIHLPEKLFDSSRQKLTMQTVRNTDRLNKYLFRRDLGRVYATTGPMDTALSREMLKVAGVIPSTLYSESDKWLADRHTDNPTGSKPLEDIVSTPPNARDSAFASLTADPDIVREILSQHHSSDPAIQAKIDDFINTHEFKTRGELLSQYNPEYRAINEELYKAMSLFEDYDPAVGFTPEQRKFLIEGKWFPKWFKAMSSRGYKDFKSSPRFKEAIQRLKEDPNAASPYDEFKPEKFMLDDLFGVMRKDILEKRIPESTLFDRHLSLGREVAQSIEDAPQQSRLLGGWATNKYTARLGRYAFDEYGADLLATDLADDPVETKLALIYKAFRDQHIGTKANVLIDQFVMSGIGQPVQGEVSVENA